MPRPEPRGGHAAAGIPWCFEWRGRLADCGACAAAGDAGDRIAPGPVVDCRRWPHCGIPPGPRRAGLVEGRNLTIVHRSADGDVARLPALAAELVRIPVAVIAAVGGDASVRSAKAATTTIPIVFTTASDPVEIGIVASLNRPGGNVTGVTFLGSLVAAKQVGLLRDIVPDLTTIGLLTSPFVPMAASITREVQAMARKAGLKAVVVSVNNDGDIDAAFSQFTEQRVEALIVSVGVFFSRQRDRLIALATRHAIPMMFTDRDFAAAGGLISYGADNKDAYRQAAL